MKSVLSKNSTQKSKDKLSSEEFKQRSLAKKALHDSLTNINVFRKLKAKFLHVIRRKKLPIPEIAPNEEMDPTAIEDFKIGLAYIQGKGVAKDYARAFDAFFQGAKKGHGECSVRLGYFYDIGIYVARNSILALYWFEEASYAQNSEGDYYLAKWYADRNPEKYAKYVTFFLEKAITGGEKKASSLKEDLIKRKLYVPSSNINSKDKYYRYAKFRNLKAIIYKNGAFKTKDIANAFEILGIDYNLHKNEDKHTLLEIIRKSYHRKMHELHPDKSSSNPEFDTQEEVLEAQKAYFLLLKVLD